MLGAVMCSMKKGLIILRTAHMPKAEAGRMGFRVHGVGYEPPKVHDNDDNKFSDYIMVPRCVV